MVGLKLFNPNYLGLVTVIATLFVAETVNGEHGVLFDTEHEPEIYLQCNESTSNPWTIDVDEKNSPSKKIFKLSPESKGCFKSKKPVGLNSATKFIIKFHSDSSQDENGNIVVRLVPLEGKCEEKECVWEVSKDPQYKKGEWVTAEYKFPLKSTKEYYVQLEANKLTSKFLLDSLAIPDGICNYLGDKHGDKHVDKINEPDRLSYANATSSPDSATRRDDFGKNVLFTTALVFTLKYLLT